MDGSAQARVGTRFAGRYDLTEVLGEGGMGAVYRARHAFTGANVALKIMHSGVARSKNARERFLREAQAPSAIGHPGIVEVSDAGVAEDGTLYLALELLDGEDLGAAVERGAVDGAAVRSIFIELLDALAAAHASGLVHRDIKPENVFLCREGSAGPRVRLLDFGITRHVKDTADEKLTQTGTILGTPHYMSPEQARGQGVDARSDIYSIGGAMFYALTGRSPFTADNYNLLIVAIMTHPAPSVRSVRPEIPSDLAAVVDRALSSDPAQRFASASEMRAALESCSAPTLEPVRPPRPDLGYEPTMPSGDAIPVASPSTPIVHSAPEPVAPGVSTRPEPTKTPRSGPAPAGRRDIPPTMASAASGASPVSATPAPEGKRSRTGLVVALVVVLGGLIGGGVAALLLAPDGAEVEPPSEPPPETAPPVVVTSTPQTTSAPDAAEAPTMEVSEAEALAERLAELEAREEARQEEEEARAIARMRAAMRRAERRAEEEAMRQQQVRRCQLDCSTELARCQREGGGMGRAALECHQAWTRCRSACER